MACFCKMLVTNCHRAWKRGGFSLSGRFGSGSASPAPAVTSSGSGQEKVLAPSRTRRGSVPAGRAPEPRQPRARPWCHVRLQPAMSQRCQNAPRAPCWGHSKETPALLFKQLPCAQRQAPSLSVMLSGCSPRPLLMHKSIMLCRQAKSNIPDKPQSLKSSGACGIEPHTPVPPLLEWGRPFV